MSDDAAVPGGSDAFDLVVRGDLVLPERTLADGYVAVRDGAIAAIGMGEAPAARQVRDASGSLVLPGAIDGQVHAGSQDGIDGLESTSRAAAAGGVTTLVDMPFDEPTPMWDLERLRAKVAAVERLCHVDAALYATLDKAGDLDLIPALAAEGACAFKFSAYEAHPTRFQRIPNPVLLEMLREIRKTGLPAGLHNEDQETVDHHIARLKAARRNSPEVYEQSRPVEAEMLATALWLEMGALTGARTHIVHASVARGFEIGAAYRAMGARATVEMVVHYLILSNEDMVARGGVLKVGPPIRPLPAREELWEQMRAGTVAFVSSDHGPWSLERKTVDDIFAVAPGVPGLETLVPALLTASAARGFDLRRAVALVTEAPARFFGLYPRKGALAVGADADLAIVAPRRWTFQAQEGFTDTGWSPFDGAAFDYRVTDTYVRGRHAFDGGRILSQPGWGRFVRPNGEAAP